MNDQSYFRRRREEPEGWPSWSCFSEEGSPWVYIHRQPPELMGAGITHRWVPVVIPQPKKD